jgi:hypothetical protein
VDLRDLDVIALVGAGLEVLLEPVAEDVIVLHELGPELDERLGRSVKQVDIGAEGR